MLQEEFAELDIVRFLNEKQKEAKASEPVREEESPLLYKGKDFRQDLEIAIAADDLSKAKSVFDSCKTAYAKAGDNSPEKAELFKTLDELYAKIKDYLKTKKKQSLEGEIATLEEEGVLHKDENQILGKLFSPVKEALIPITEETKQTSDAQAPNSEREVIAARSEVKSLPIMDPTQLLKKWEERIKVKVQSPVGEPAAPIIIPVSGSTLTAEPFQAKQERQHICADPQRVAAERLMEDKIKERINESCGVIKLAVEKKDLGRAVIEYNKLKETYALIPSVLGEEKVSIYSKILALFNQIKKLEQEKLMTHITGSQQKSLTEEELVDKLALTVDRTQALLLNQDLKKAIEEYEKATDLFEMLPDTLPEIKNKFLVDLARLYQGLQNLNVFLQNKKEKPLFKSEPAQVLKKYAVGSPLEEIKKSEFKIQKYLQAKSLRSAMLEFNKIKDLCQHLPQLPLDDKKALMEEIEALYAKVEELHKEMKSDAVLQKPVLSDEAHLTNFRIIHANIRELHALLQTQNFKDAKEKLIDLQHQIALLPDVDEQGRLLNVVDQLCQKAHFNEQNDRLNK